MNGLTDIRKQLQTEAHELATSKIALRAAEVDETEEYPWDNVKLLTEAG